MKRLAMILVSVCVALWSLASLPPLRADPLPGEVIADYIMPPFSLGDPVNEKGVWTLLNSGGAEAGYVFETEPLAPLPGFSGAPINLLVILDLEGRFMDVRLIAHNEPIFVSGLGEAPFHAFFEQYRGLSISTPMVVGTPYGDAGGSLTYLDGVTKATASVRIAHESLLAATRAVAREKMQGLASGPPAHPKLDYEEPLDWETALAEGLVGRLRITNAEVNDAFAGTIWESDDPEAQDDPEGIYLDLYLVDLGPPSLAKAVLSEDGYEELQSFQSISGDDEPLLVIDAGRHGLVSEDFVRNTAPDQLGAEQDGLPIALRDADLFVELHDDLPWQLHDGVAMILRTDRRLGFDPSREWTLKVEATRDHGIFQPDRGSVSLDLHHATPDRFFEKPAEIRQAPPWQTAIENRQTDLIVLGVGVMGLVSVLGLTQNRLSRWSHYPTFRLVVLAGVLGFVGWWGQGQLSIVTAMATLNTAISGGSFAFLLYDPFSLAVWGVAILGFIAWGRGLFCGWLCPFGALQEFADRIGRALRLPQIEPNQTWDARLKLIKYAVLASLVGVTICAPQHIDKAAEVEPFKTAITVYFDRNWYYVAYAAGWLLLGMVLFKGFCRYVCPLGALMAIGGALRARSWVPRRAECGSPCQLCKVKCRYGAIERSGAVAYSECFQCLDCVTIHEDENQCVPLILAAKQRRRSARSAPVPILDGVPAE